MTGPVAARRAPVAALTAFLAALVALGGVIAAGVLHGERPAHPATALRAFGVGDDVATSFGAVAVESVQRVDGLTHRQLSGAAHGIQSLVPRGREQIEVDATLTNLSRSVQTYAADQFRLVETRGRMPSPDDTRRDMTSTSLHRGALQPNAAIDARLTFVVPRNGRRLFLEYRERGRSKPVAIELGRTGSRISLVPHAH